MRLMPRSLRARLFILVAAAVLPAVALLLTSASEQRSREREHIRQQARDRVARANSRGRLILAETERVLEVIAQVPAVKEGADDACSTFLSLTEKRYPFRPVFAALDHRGRVVCASSAFDPGLSFATAPWFRELENGASAAVSDVLKGPISGRWIRIVAVPVPGSPAIAAVCAGIDFTWLYAFAVDSQLARDATLAVFDVDGLILARYPDPERWVGRRIPDAELLRVAARDHIGAGELSGFDGVERLFAYAPLAGDQSGVYLAHGIPAGSAFASLAAELRRSLILLGLTALAAFAAAWVVADLVVVRRVRRLVEGARRLRGGRLDARSEVGGDDEIGELGAAFDEMAASLQARERERDRTEAEVSALNARLADRVEELGAVNRELESFAYSVSHDLRAPLRAIDGFSRIVIEDHADQLDAGGQRYLGLVRANTQQMGRLIDDLLSFSRLGRASMEVRPVVLEEVVRTALADLIRERAGRNVEIELGRLPIVQADAALLRQVLVNLLGNALKFTRGRDPARIEVRCTPQRGMEVCTVRDNGVGFDMRYADKLFGVFQRLHRAEEFEGTGVGLATVQRIIHRHGGRIWAESELGQGAAFHFTLPGEGEA